MQHHRVEAVIYVQSAKGHRVKIFRLKFLVCHNFYYIISFSYVQTQADVHNVGIK